MRLTYLALFAWLVFQNSYSQITMNTPDSSLVAKLIDGRTFFDGLGKSYLPSNDISIEPATIMGVSCYWFNPKQYTSKKLIIYLHGGGFAMGSIHSHQALVSHITHATNTRTLFIDYALSPEHPHPHGLRNLLDVYRDIIANDDYTEVFLIGDSAGGGLIVLAIEQLQKKDIRQPNGIILISPWTNLNADTPSYRENASIDPILSIESVHGYALGYNPLNLREANPASIQFKQFPPTLIFVGTQEILLDDSKILYDQIRKVQSDAVIKIVPNQTHVWMLTNIDHQDSKNALVEMKAFIDKR
jgi:monoterpene epsilon-lactone hydrolase